MATTITFVQIKNCLDAIADANGLIGSSPHGRFWDVSYQNFITGNVPHVNCQGNPVPIIDSNAPRQSPFYLILTNPKGWCGKRQMPGGGPFITQDAFVFTLPDGSTQTGAQIRAVLEEWLGNGFPE